MYLESIWEEIQTRNRPMRRYLEAKIKKLGRRVASMPIVTSEDEATSEESDEEIGSENDEVAGSDVEIDEDAEDEEEDDEMDASGDESDGDVDDEVDAGDIPLTEQQEDEMEKYLGKHNSTPYSI